jgi:PIN domain
VRRFHHLENAWDEQRYYLAVTKVALVETISIDTQVFVATGFGFSSKAFQSLKNHFASGRLKLVMTDITIREVHTTIKQSVAEELVFQRSLINEAHALFNSSIPEVRICLYKT